MGSKSSKPTPSPTPEASIQYFSNLARAWLIGCDVPGPVEDLEVVADPTKPSITLRWRPPSNLHEVCRATDVKFLIRVTNVDSSAVVDETRLKWDSFFHPVTYTYTKSTLAPMTEYSFKVVVTRTLGVQGEPRCVQQYFSEFQSVDCHVSKTTILDCLVIKSSITIIDMKFLVVYLYKQEGEPPCCTQFVQVKRAPSTVMKKRA